MANPNADLETGTVHAGARIGGRFSVLSLLGRGGMADVYRVRDDVSGRELALKRLRRLPGQDRRSLALFEREYHTLAQISHPCVIAVCDYGVDEHGAYYTMELVDGRDLRARGRLPWREACRVLRDVASALAALHARRWLHRDLSPRNVLCTDGGATKLIDFGAMAPMGVARALVGTPPLVPPEALQQQNLDARADLYALGALAYFVLTGRHAYPARDFEELRDLWRSIPRRPDRLAPELPAALTELVLELLSLDRGARPASASAVIERLTNVLGDAAEVGADPGAFLPSPKLVGRDHALAAARAALLEPLRGRGAALLVEGDPGSGKSRFLDACVLEAKLLGAIVLRADASDGARGEYGAAAALGEQLLHAAPEQAVESARLRAKLLGSVIPGLADTSGEAAPAGAFERRHVQTALRDWLLAIARSRRIVIAIDDIDRIDEPSAAFLASLSHRSQRRKLVVIATATRASPGAAVEVLRTTASRVEMAPLSLTQTETLLASLFGDARGRAAVALRVFEAARGNPRHSMELAEHLVRRGVARYAGGTWILPQALAADELPASIAATLALRLDELDADARELAQALSLTDPQALPASAFAALLPSADAARAYRALDALATTGILQPEGERYRFAHERYRELLAGGLAAEHRRALHGRLVGALGASGCPVRLSHHLWHAGEERRAIEVLLEQRHADSLEHTDALIDLLEHAVGAAERLGLPRRSRLELRLWLTVISAPLARLPLFLRHAPDLLRELTRASGLADYHELGDGIPAEERLRRALGRAQVRYDALPPAERPWAPVEAIPELARMIAAFCALAASAFDLRLAEGLPSLAPLAPLSPAIAVVQLLADSIRTHQAGRYEHAHALQQQILRRIAEDDRAGLDPTTHRKMRCGILYSLGILEAMSGDATALSRVAELRDQPGFRANAWRLQVIYHSMQGDLEEARRSERRAELIQLQDGASQNFPGTGLYSMVIVHWLADDIDGLKQFVEPMRAMAERFPGWQVPYALTQCHYLRMKGDVAGALAIVERLRETAGPGRHLACCWVASTHVMLLSALGRHDEAVARGTEFLERCRALGFGPDDYAIAARGTAEALAAAGRHEQAVQLADSVLGVLEAAGVRGLRLGSWCETRARIALAMRDDAGFELWAERCGDEYTRGGYPALCAKYGRLLQQARRQALVRSVPPQGAVAAREVPADAEQDGLHATVWSRMAECVDAAERARCALLLLMEQTHAHEGHLYALIEGGLAHVVSEPAARTRTDLQSVLEPRVEAELRATDTTAVRGKSVPPPIAEQNGVVPSGLRCVVLAATRDGETAVAAAAALGVSDEFESPSPALLQAIAQSLLDHDDVDPLTRLV